MLPELQGGYQIVSPDSEKWHNLVSCLAEKHGIDRRRIESFTNVHRRPDHSIFVPPGVSKEAAEELVTYLDDNAWVSFPDIVYHSGRLVEMASFIPRGLACRFAWMLIDEFQDTSEGQVAILLAVSRHHKTKFFLVGDPNQSIMGFAGAHPRLMQSFPAELGARTDLRLPGNYRCSKRIVAHAERLIPTEPRMRAIGEWKDSPIEPEHVHTEDPITGIFDHYLPAVDQLGISLGEAAVLAPWWVSLYHLARELRGRGVPVIGTGARPYRRSRLLASLAELLCAYTEDRNPRLFRPLQRALFTMLLRVTGSPPWRVFSYDGRRCLCGLVGLAQDIREEYAGAAVAWLRNVADGITSRLVKCEFLASAHTHAIRESSEDMIRDMERNRIDTAALSVSDLGLYARSSECLQLITMHSSKGREFDAVAIVDLHDGRVPHFSCQTQEEYDEARRQLYVAITRARKLLMYFTDLSNFRNRPSPFLVEMGIVQAR